MGGEGPKDSAWDLDGLVCLLSQESPRETKEGRESKTSGDNGMAMSCKMMFHYFRHYSPGLLFLSCKPCVALPLEVFKAEGVDELKASGSAQSLQGVLQ